MNLIFGVILCAAATLANPTPRIVGGQIAYAGEFPYVAALYITKNGPVNFCAGALISGDWILTSAGCLNGASLVTILLGTTALDSTQESVVRLTSTTTILHPDFDPNTFENDIGLVQIQPSVLSTTRIRPISVALSPLQDGEAGQVLGWGKTQDADVSLTNDLRYTTLWAMSNADCKSKYGDQIVGNMVCFTSDQVRGTCQGDQGSPLIKHVLGSSTELVAISSFLSNTGCESGDPSGFTSVYEYQSWILEATS